MKKFLAIILTLVLILGSTGAVFGASATDIKGLPCETAVTALSDAGIISGYSDGTFRPQNAITRGEMIKMLTEALGYGFLAPSMGSDFTDTGSHWAKGHIGLGVEMGLVKGYSDNTFRPDKTVTYNEAITFILRALGYTDDYILARKGSSYPTAYINLARKLDIVGNVPVGDKAANRGDVALLIYQAWELTRGTVQGKDFVPYETPDTMKNRSEALGQIPDTVMMTLARSLTYGKATAAMLNGEFGDKYAELMNSARGKRHENYEPLLEILNLYKMELGAERIFLLHKEPSSKKYVKVTLDACETPAVWQQFYSLTPACDAAFSGLVSANLYAEETKQGLVWEAYVPFYTSGGELAGVVAIDGPAKDVKDYPQWIKGKSVWNGMTYDANLLSYIVNE